MDFLIEYTLNGKTEHYIVEDVKNKDIAEEDFNKIFKNIKSFNIPNFNIEIVSIKEYVIKEQQISLLDMLK